jgi:hypothetical protein
VRRSKRYKEYKENKDEPSYTVAQANAKQNKNNPLYKETRPFTKKQQQTETKRKGQAPTQNKTTNTQHYWRRQSPGSHVHS